MRQLGPVYEKGKKNRKMRQSDLVYEQEKKKIEK